MSDQGALFNLEDKQYTVLFNLDDLRSEFTFIYTYSLLRVSASYDPNNLMLQWQSSEHIAAVPTVFKL